MAERCNVTARTIQRIESGQVKPRAHTIKVISETLGFDFFGSTQPHEKHSIIWHLKDLFNLKTQKMKKISILSSSMLIMAMTTFLVVSKIQAQSVKKQKPKSGITIIYNKDNSIKRIDAVFTNKLTLDSLMNMSEILREKKIIVAYRSMEFNKNGQLTGISCEVSENHSPSSGSFSVNYLDSSNKDKSFGFYYDYSTNSKSSFCTGSCW